MDLKFKSLKRLSRYYVKGSQRTTLSEMTQADVATRAGVSVEYSI